MSSFGASNGPKSPEKPMANQVKFENALDYLEAIKKTFQATPDKYDSFLGIMKDFKSGKLTTPQVMEMVKSLFANEKKLQQGLAMFLPPEFQDRYLASCEIDDSTKEIELNKEAERLERDTEIFTDSFHSAFSHQPDSVTLFTELLENWKIGETPDESLFESVAILLQKNRILQAAFVMCLPVDLANLYTKFVRAFNEGEGGDTQQEKVEKDKYVDNVENALRNIVLRASSQDPTSV